MRPATIDRHFWQLESAEARHAAHPQFRIPDRAERERLQRGQAAKLLFEIEGETEDGTVERVVERMWVLVAERVGDGYVGILDNQPESLDRSPDVYLTEGAEIPFWPEHVIAIDQPPPEWIAERLGRAPARRWPRDDDGGAVRIVDGGLDDARVVALLRTHVSRALAETARGSVHALDVPGLRAPDIAFWSAWEGEGDGAAVVGVAALRALSPEHGEVKSMHTAEARRGRGIGRALLRRVVDAARARGMTRLSLETGASPYFASARALYARHGFVECAPFGEYAPDPNSVFMTLALRDTPAP